MPPYYYRSGWFFSVAFLASLGLLAIITISFAYAYLPPHPVLHLISLLFPLGVLLLREAWGDYLRDRYFFGAPPWRILMNERHIAIASLIGFGLGTVLGLGVLMLGILMKIYLPSYFDIPGTCLFLALLGVGAFYFFGRRLITIIGEEWDRYQVIKKQEAQGGYTNL